MRTAILILFISFRFLSPALAAETDPAKNPADEALLSKMSLRKKIGQLFLVGFLGQKISDGLDETIRDVAPGGLIVFGRNMSSARQIADLLAEAQSRSLKDSRVPLLIATDQEGGNVIRIKTSMPLPSPLAFGRINDPILTERAGFATGQLMKMLGFNMNLAPVLDIADPKLPMFVGTRTYGNEPELVARMGASFASGLARAGVLPTGKHFPGHGGINEDSHLKTPEKSQTLEELRQGELVPFFAMQNRLPNAWAAMLAHIAYPKIDPSGAPATLSRIIINDVLRSDMGFNGIVLTDDIDMAGAGKARNTRDRVVKALDAGADMIIVAWNKKLQRDLVSAIEAEVRKGRLALARIDESVRRILAMKRSYARPASRPPSQKQLHFALNNPVFDQIGEAAVQARLKGPQDIGENEFREFAAEKPILVFSANVRFATTFKGALKGRDVRTFRLDVDRPFDVDKIMRSNPSSVGVFYVSGYQAARVAARISEDVARRILLVTVETKGILKNVETFRYSTDVYYRHPNLGRLIAGHYFSGAAELRSPAAQAKSKP